MVTKFLPDFRILFTFVIRAESGVFSNREAEDDPKTEFSSEFRLELTNLGPTHFGALQALFCRRIDRPPVADLDPCSTRIQ